MARRNCTPEENARWEKICELLQMSNIGSIDDIPNLFKKTIAEFMENGLEAELELGTLHSWRLKLSVPLVVVDQLPYLLGYLQ